MFQEEKVKIKNNVHYQTYVCPVIMCLCRWSRTWIQSARALNNFTVYLDTLIVHISTYFMFNFYLCLCMRCVFLQLTASRTLTLILYFILINNIINIKIKFKLIEYLWLCLLMKLLVWCDVHRIIEGIWRGKGENIVDFVANVRHDIMLR